MERNNDVLFYKKALMSEHQKIIFLEIFIVLSVSKYVWVVLILGNFEFLH